MTSTQPMLHMLCGKIASGKSTLAQRLAQDPATLLLSEDRWLAGLFGDQMTSVSDYLRCSARLRGMMEPHVADLLSAGLSVVLDFPANTVETRGWMRAILRATGAAHRMHVIEAPDALCLARLRARNAAGTHPFAPTEAQFHRVTAHFAPPTPEEGFTVLHHAPGGDGG